MNVTFIKCVVSIVFFILTMACVLPWLINTDVLPMPVIVSLVAGIFILWGAFLEKPLAKLYKLFKENLS